MKEIETESEYPSQCHPGKHQRQARVIIIMRAVFEDASPEGFSLSLSLSLPLVEIYNSFMTVVKQYHRVCLGEVSAIAMEGLGKG